MMASSCYDHVTLKKNVFTAFQHNCYRIETPWSLRDTNNGQTIWKVTNDVIIAGSRDFKENVATPVQQRYNCH